MDDALKSLKKWVIDEGQCVTKSTLLRRTSLDTRRIQSLMSDFYEKNKDLPLSAMFMVLGMKKLENEDGSPIRQSTICSDSTLEKTKSDFDKVISVNIYSLHRNPATSVQTLLNTDWSGKYEKPLVPLEQRLGIVSEQALKALQSKHKSHSNTAYSSHIIPPFVVKVKKEVKPVVRNLVIKSDQHSLKDAFALAAKMSANQAEDDKPEEPSKKRTKPIKTSDISAKKKVKITHWFTS